MGKFAFGKSGPNPSFKIFKFLLGWHCVGLLFYNTSWKPRVQKKAEEDGYEWDKLSTGQRYALFIGRDLKHGESRKIFKKKIDMDSAHERGSLIQPALCETKAKNGDGSENATNKPKSSAVDEGTESKKT